MVRARRGVEPRLGWVDIQNAIELQSVGMRPFFFYTLCFPRLFMVGVDGFLGLDKSSLQLSEVFEFSTRI